MRNRRIILFAALLTSGTLFVPQVHAASGSLTIATVGGQAVRNGRVAGGPLAGPVEVTGTATLDGVPGAGPSPLVADAGDSPFVPAGSSAELLGMAFGGTAPHTFAWTASAGTITEGADSATALLDTTGVAPGLVTATLTVTDATGASDSDEVVVVVAATTSSRPVDEDRVDAGPGVLSVGAPGVLDFPFEVPAGTDRIQATGTWTVATNDYDLVLLDPTGTQRVIDGQPPGVTEEAVEVLDPEPGTWTAQLQKFATVADTVHVTVDLTGTSPDPRPEVDAGGPYRFLIGEPQPMAGTVTGGVEPVVAAWDLDGDGVFEAPGTEVVGGFEPGRHLVTFKVTDATGVERRETVSVLVADAARLAEETTAVTVIGVADTGINPYHSEFSAATYPDPDVLALTANFTRHPSEYLPGYPADAPALPVTLGQGYLPEADVALWEEGVEGQTLYWIPGTKIVGAIDTGEAEEGDVHPILDDNGHGSGSASVSTGNRYGYCPTCLLVMVESLDPNTMTTYPWVDITSHSFGYQAGLPVGLALGPNENLKTAVERGQTVLFAAGNGIGNAFDVPIATYGSDQTGPDWTITVGAIRRDSQRGIVGDGIPVHLSAWGDGNLPSACRTGTVGQCAFGGTSAATPYTAGVFGTVLTEVRDAIGDETTGQRPGQVVARGIPVDESVYLADGALTRAELRDAVLRTAVPLAGEASMFPFPVTNPYNSDTNVLFEGYGAATPESAQRAVDVLLGRTPVPERPAEDEFFAIDRRARDTLYGGYDRDGDGEEDYEGIENGVEGLTFDDLLDVDPAELAGTVEGTLAILDELAALGATAPEPSVGEGAETWFLHRRYSGDPGGSGCDHGSNELYVDRTDTEGDIEPCFESRITSVPAAYRPLGIWAATEVLDAPLPAGSTVSVDLYLTTEVPALVRPTGVLMATDRELGSGAGNFAVSPGSGPGPGSDIGALVAVVPLPDLGGCAALGEACWTRYQWSFTTDRPAFAGEALTFQAQLLGTRAWSFGYEGAHASSVTITPAPVPETGFEFGATIISPADGDRLEEGTVVAGGTAAFPDQGEDPTGAGDHPADRRVEVALDDPAFGAVVEASYDEASGTWSVPLRDVGPGEHVLHARARVGELVSAADTVAFSVRPANRVEWQVVDRNAAPDPDGWQDATGLEAWSFTFDAAAYGSGAHTVITRLVSSGLVLAQQSVSIRLA